MNRAERRRAERQAHRDRKKGTPQDPVDESVVRQVFGGEGSEALTEEVVIELVAKGWPEADLRAAAEQGASYCRPRHSLIFPPAFE